MSKNLRTVLVFLSFLLLSFVLAACGSTDIASAPPAALPVAVPMPVGSSFEYIPILMYHYMGDVPSDQIGNKIREDLTVSAGNFEAQLKWLKEEGYTSVTLREAVEAYGETPPAPLPERPVVLTFDDGYDDAYTVALPLLKKYGMTGTFGIITGKAGKPGYMTWEQIVKLNEAGMEIVAHTVSHLELPTLSDNVLASELENSRKILEKNLGHPVRDLVYPSGKYDERVMAAAKAAGYLSGRTTKRGVVTKDTNSFELPVLRVHGNTTLEQFRGMFGNL